MYRLAGKRVYVAGHGGMVGSAIVRRLAVEDCEVITANRAELDLRDQAAVRAWISDRKPQAIFIAAAKVGGIAANDSAPADFLFDNLAIETNLIEAAHRNEVEKLLFLGSSCIYPRDAPQPISESALLSGPLEPTNQWYAVAKIAGVKLAQAYRRQHERDFISAMPTNLYGPGDNFDLQSSHVLPALLRKAHEAKRDGGPLVIWGSGQQLREFLYVDDCADACVFLMKTYSGEAPVNVGSGEEVSILELARLVGDAVGFDGEIRCDRSRPEGTPRKLLDIARLREAGWVPRTALSEGLVRTYSWFLEKEAGPPGAGL